MKGVGNAISAAFGDASVKAGNVAGNKAGSGFSGGFAAKIGVIGGIASGVFSKAVDAVAGLSGQILQASDSTQKFAQTLQFAGIGNDQIKKLTASTQDYANKTVYGIDDIRNTTAQLAANGVPNYEQLAEAAGNLNAVAGGNANTFKSVAMMLTQTAGAGKLTTENWNQLADAIPGASGKLQEAMLKNGAYTGNFRDAMAKGQITSEEFNKALMQLGMEDTAKKAATATSTFEGAWGNLQATIVDGLAQALNSIKPFLTTLINGFGTVLQKVGAAVVAIVGPIAQFVGWLNQIGLLVPIISGVLAALATVALASLIAAMPAIIAGLMGAVAATWAWTAALLANPLTWVALAIGAVVAALVYFFTQTETGKAIWQGFMSWLQAAWTNVSGFFQSLWNGIVGFFRSAGTNAQNAWNAVVSWFQGIPGAIGGFFSGIGARIGGFFQNAANNVRNIWNAVTGWFSGIPGRIIGFFGGIGGGIGRFFQSAANFVGNIWNNVVGFFAGIPWRILSALGNVDSLLWNAGSSIISGLLDGLKSAWSRVTGFVSNIVGWIAAHKGPLSYDARLLVPAGNVIMSGFGNALQKSFRANVVPFVSGVDGQLAGMVSGTGITGSMTAGYAFNGKIPAPAQAAVSTPVSSSAGDIVIPVYIGSQRLDELVVTAQQRANYRSGGR